MGFPGGSDGKEPACNAGVSGLIAGLGGFPGEGNGNPLQYSCPERIHKESDMTEQLAYISLLFLLISHRPCTLFSFSFFSPLFCPKLRFSLWLQLHLMPVPKSHHSYAQTALGPSLVTTVTS